LESQIVRAQHAAREQLPLAPQILHGIRELIRARRVKQGLSLQPKLVSAPSQRGLERANLTEVSGENGC
jgi:hypothetical protein